MASFKTNQYTQIFYKIILAWITFDVSRCHGTRIRHDDAWLGFMSLREGMVFLDPTIIHQGPDGGSLLLVDEQYRGPLWVCLLGKPKGVFDHNAPSKPGCIAIGDTCECYYWKYVGLMGSRSEEYPECVMLPVRGNTTETYILSYRLDYTPRVMAPGITKAILQSYMQISPINARPAMAAGFVGAYGDVICRETPFSLKHHGLTKTFRITVSATGSRPQRNRTLHTLHTILFCCLVFGFLFVVFWISHNDKLKSI